VRARIAAVTFLSAVTSLPVVANDNAEELDGVDPRLQRVVERAQVISQVPFRVVGGVRTRAEQRKLVEHGDSWTMQSRHLTGHAVDVVALPDGEVSWKWRHYEQIALAMRAAARQYRVCIVWGGDWKVRDGMHFHICRAPD